MKNRHIAMLMVALLLAPLAALHAVDAPEPVGKPNNLFAIADDWSFTHVGAYGCKWVKTPAMDRVAREGILFTPAYPSITVAGEGNASVRDERWYFIRYKDGTEEFYDMERDPIQWTNLVTSKDPEIRSHKARLAALFPSSFAPNVASDKKDKGGKEEKGEALDLTIKPQRAAAQLK